ncbi:zinc finger protein 214-like [Cotesia glomerata]|uniref:zinc finger protein 214-like n=1 Tax=Cotesia glomerata TaxID=32391 RepID=UPI001D01DE5A|nr:zinc finger protein 214-like [Cotesia glomerata]
MSNLHRHQKSHCGQKKNTVECDRSLKIERVWSWCVKSEVSSNPEEENSTNPDLESAEPQKAVPRVNKPNTTFVCASCGRKYARKSSLRRHKKKCVVEPTLQCIICEEKFYKNYQLELHMKQCLKRIQTRTDNL